MRRASRSMRCVCAFCAVCPSFKKPRKIQSGRIYASIIIYFFTFGRFCGLYGRVPQLLLPERGRIMGKNLDWLKNLAVTVVALGAVVTAVGFVPRDAGYVYTVGIVQLVRHTALDAATQGFTDELQSLMEEAGKTVKIDYQDAQNDTVNCSVIANNFVAKGYDLIMANATAALQASYNATETIPVLGTSVTVYDVALGLDNYVSGEGTGTNVSGTSDLAPLSEQADMIAELVPEARKVGLLYCSSEANSRYQVEEVKRCLEERNEGYECTLYAFSDSNDISAVVQQMAAQSEVVYVPTDNTVASNTQLIDSICRPAGIPVIAGEEGICSGCGIATLSISYENLGRITAGIAARILLGGEYVGDIPIAYDEAPVRKYNAEICEELGIEIPDGYEPISA